MYSVLYFIIISISPLLYCNSPFTNIWYINQDFCQTLVQISVKFLFIARSANTERKPYVHEYTTFGVESRYDTLYIFFRSYHKHESSEEKKNKNAPPYQAPCRRWYVELIGALRRIHIGEWRRILLCWEMQPSRPRAPSRRRPHSSSCVD